MKQWKKIKLNNNERDNAMPVKLIEKNEGKLLEIQMSGKLDKEDYANFVPVVEKMVKKHGKVSMLVYMRDFHGWTAGALWEDIKFDAKHFSDIERLAIVGETQWEKGMAIFCKPFTSAKIRYFDHSAINEANVWIEAY
jgi:hypothetical protein